jgi:hypothetical protein
MAAYSSRASRGKTSTAILRSALKIALPKTAICHPQLRDTVSVKNTATHIRSHIRRRSHGDPVALVCGFPGSPVAQTDIIAQAKCCMQRPLQACPNRVMMCNMGRAACSSADLRSNRRRFSVNLSPHRKRGIIAKMGGQTGFKTHTECYDRH